MSETSTLPDIAMPETIQVEKNDAVLTIPWRKKKSGDNAGTPTPYIDKNITLENVVQAFSPEFVLRCALTRINTALGDWHDDVVEKHGLFILEEFVRRVKEGRVVRMSMEELNEALDEVRSRLDKLTEDIDANGGLNSPEGFTANAARIIELRSLVDEQKRLVSQKSANKRKRKKEDENDND